MNEIYIGKRGVSFRQDAPLEGFLIEFVMVKVRLEAFNVDRSTGSQSQSQIDRSKFIISIIDWLHDDGRPVSVSRNVNTAVPR